MPKFWTYLSRVADLFQVTPENAARWIAGLIRSAIFGGVVWAMTYLLAPLSQYDPVVVMLASAATVALVVFAAERTLAAWRGSAKRAAAETEERGQKLDEWLDQRHKNLTEVFEMRLRHYEYQSEQTLNRLVETLDRMYRQFSGRLENVETMGAEGPWVTVTIPDGRKFQLTDEANRDFESRSQPVRNRITNTFLNAMVGRFGKRSVQVAAGDVYYQQGQPDRFYGDVASLSEVEREALFNADPALGRWFNERTRERAQ